MKKLLCLMLAVAMMLGCVALADEDGKLTIWAWDQNFNIKAMNIAKEYYQKDHPDVEIEIIEKLSSDREVISFRFSTVLRLSSSTRVTLVSISEAFAPG